MSLETYTERALRITTANKYLVDRIVELTFGRSSKLDSRHTWFFSLVTEGEADIAIQYLTEEDLKQDLYLYILESLIGYIKSDSEFKAYLRKALVWHAVRIIKSLNIYHMFLINYQYIEDIVIDAEKLSCTFDLRWILAKSDLALTTYEKYILYLRLYKCYTIQNIADILYQSRETIRFTLKDSLRIVRSYYEETRSKSGTKNTVSISE